MITELEKDAIRFPPQCKLTLTHLCSEELVSWSKGVQVISPRKLPMTLKILISWWAL
jgi:hypothetical protein